MSRPSLFSYILNLTAAGLCTLLTGCGLWENEGNEIASAPIVMKPEMSMPQPVVVKKHKIALLVPLSGLHAETGYSLQRAAEMGLFEHSDENLELVVKDTFGTAEGARKATKEALAERVELIIGPLLSHEVTAAATIAHGRIPILAFSNNRAVASNSVFIMGHAPAEQVERIAHFAVTQDVNDITVVTPQNEYGSLVAAVFQSLHNQKIITVKSFITYDPHQPTDLTMSSNVAGHGIFFAEGGFTLIHVMDTLQNQGINYNQYKLFGISQWDDSQTLRNMRLRGSYFASCIKENRMDFEQKYETNYHAKTLKITSMAYDAVSLVAALLKSEGNNKPFSMENLTQPKGFMGVDGLFRLKANGYVERGLAVYEITGGQEMVVDPAPRLF